MQNQAMQKWAEQLRGCRVWTRVQARDVLDRQRASGLSITVFAQRMGFVPQRLYWWQNRLAQKPNAPERVPESFVPVVVRGGGNEDACRISVELGQGVRLLVHEVDACTAGWVALLLHARGRS